MKNTTTEEGEEEEHLPPTERSRDDSEWERAGGYAMDGVNRGGNSSKFAPSPTC